MQKVWKIKRSNLWLILTGGIFLPFILFWSIDFQSEFGYYFLGFLVLLCAMLPFGFLYETRGPTAREILLVASLSSIAVMSRLILYPIPQFKPMSAIVVLSGAVLGPEAGFLTGAMSIFVSNFFFGQGPWTVYQMAGLGLIGMLAGIILRNKHESKMIVCLFGFVSVLVCYGGIVNMGTYLSMGKYLGTGGLLMIFAAGLPMDLVHAVSTAIFLYWLEQPFIEKLLRLRVKYGFMSTNNRKEKRVRE